VTCISALFPLSVSASGLTQLAGGVCEGTVLTAAEIRNTQFALTRRHSGYDPEDVDTFLARTEAELDRLIRENQELRGIVPPPPASHSRSRSGRRRGQAGGQPFKLTIIFALIFLVGAVGCGFGIAWMHSEGDRSSYTQAAGIAETATVTSVTTTGPKNPQTDISVLLDTPVDHQFVSDVYVPGDHSYSAGDKIRILVDPRDPSYSELPGQPDAFVLPMMVCTALLGLLFAATAVACLARAFRIRQRRRQFWRHLPAA
jgi:DivIVA domain-containing protein